jgi:preprotein translocase subunit Sss1
MKKINRNVICLLLQLFFTSHIFSMENSLSASEKREEVSRFIKELQETTHVFVNSEKPSKGKFFGRTEHIQPFIENLSEKYKNITIMNQSPTQSDLLSPEYGLLSLFNIPIFIFDGFLTDEEILSLWEKMPLAHVYRKSCHNNKVFKGFEHITQEEEKFFGAFFDALSDILEKKYFSFYKNG